MPRTKPARHPRPRRKPVAPTTPRFPAMPPVFHLFPKVMTFFRLPARPSRRALNSFAGIGLATATPSVLRLWRLTIPIARSSHERTSPLSRGARDPARHPAGHACRRGRRPEGRPVRRRATARHFVAVRNDGRPPPGRARRLAGVRAQPAAGAVPRDDDEVAARGCPAVEGRPCAVCAHGPHRGRCAGAAGRHREHHAAVRHRRQPGQVGRHGRRPLVHVRLRERRGPAGPGRRVRPAFRRAGRVAGLGGVPERRAHRPELCRALGAQQHRAAAGLRLGRHLHALGRRRGHGGHGCQCARGVGRRAGLRLGGRGHRHHRLGRRHRAHRPAPGHRLRLRRQRREPRRQRDRRRPRHVLCRHCRRAEQRRGLGRRGSRVQHHAVEGGQQRGHDVLQRDPGGALLRGRPRRRRHQHEPRRRHPERRRHRDGTAVREQRGGRHPGGDRQREQVVHQLPGVQHVRDRRGRRGAVRRPQAQLERGLRAELGRGRRPARLDLRRRALVGFQLRLGDEGRRRRRRHHRADDPADL